MVLDRIGDSEIVRCRHEKAASLQRADQQHRLEEWGRRVEACQSSGLSVGQWGRENGIAAFTYFSCQRKVFRALQEVQEVTFAEMPIMDRPQPSGHVVADTEVSGVWSQVYAGNVIFQNHNRTATAMSTPVRRDGGLFMRRKIWRLPHVPKKRKTSQNAERSPVTLVVTGLLSGTPEGTRIRML